MDPYNDGFMSYGENQPIYSSTGKRLGASFLPSGRFAYTEMSIRDQDYQMVDTLGRTLDMKITTMYPPHFESLQRDRLTSFKVKVKNTLYEVVSADKDRNKSEIFWYLQKVGDERE